MKISELIGKLTEIQAQHGDIEARVHEHKWEWDVYDVPIGEVTTEPGEHNAAPYVIIPWAME